VANNKYGKNQAQAKQLVAAKFSLTNYDWAPNEPYILVRREYIILKEYANHIDKLS
jgi:hypothetical protein